MTGALMRYWNILWLFLLSVLLPSGIAEAQPGNHWINFSQQYYKIQTARGGIYKLTYADLQAAGIPVDAIDPRRLQLFHRGKEQAILVSGQADAILNTNDYLEFYGQGNDGTLDKGLYKPSTAQPHSYYNLYSDSTAYFLTWSLGAVPGKRIATFDEVNVTNIPKEIFHNEQRLIINKSQYSVGFTHNDVIQHTFFDVGEGWTGDAISPGKFLDYTIDQISNIESGSGNPQLEILLVGRDFTLHALEILVGPDAGSLRSVHTSSFTGFEKVTTMLPLLWSDIGADGKLIIRLSGQTALNNRPQFSASYLKLSFPQNFQSSGLTEKVFYLRGKPGGKSYVEWVNAPGTMRVWDVTNSASVTAINTRQAGSNRTAVVGSTETPRTLYAFTSTRSPAIRKISFRLIDPKQPDYIIISNRLLMKPASSYTDAVKAYASYRASVNGGSYDTLVVSMDQLYNQFNYGETSPMAIYEFMRYLVENGQPKYLFLIGKGRDVSAGYHRIVNPGPGLVKDLVPSAGMPGSDMYFTAGLNGTTYEPAVPTGRLSATRPDEVASYLNKIMETENPEALQGWQKRGLHLSGGIGEYERPAFRSFLDGFKSTGEGIYWGGSINTIAKQEPEPVEIIDISEKVNDGVNLITYFGHSAPNLMEIDIGFVTDPKFGYDNRGKYPAFLINGCNAGSFFLQTVLFGEDWVNAANRGARNFIGHSSFGFASTLRSYSDYFYRIGFTDSIYIRKGIGDVQKEVARQYMEVTAPHITNITQVQQMVLLGDPAVRLLQHQDPDYEITNSSLSLFSFDGKPVTALSDSFAIKMVVRNNGVVKNKPAKIRMTRTFRNGSSVTSDSVFAPLIYQDTLLFIMHRGVEDGSGENTFLVKIDPDNSIHELNEGNNEATYATAIISSATLNLYPVNYSIESRTLVEFILQTSDPRSAKRDFLLEVDTTLSFNSPYKIRKTLSGKVLAVTTIDLLDRDSTVYFWRTSFDKPADGESEGWSTSSFSYIKNSAEGWAQLRKDQTKENFFNGIISDGEGKPFRFEENKTSIRVETFGSTNPLPATDVSVKINDAEYNLSNQGQPCRNHTLNFIAFNKTTAVPYAGIPFIFQDPRTCGRTPQLINSFAASELETGLGDDLAAFIDAVGVSDSVVMFSIGDPDYTGWSSSIKAKLGELGVGLTELNSLQSGEPLIIFGKKGATPGSAAVFRTPFTPASEQLIIVAREITGRKTEGIMKSVLIGPAAEWNQFIVKEPSAEPSDEITFQLLGVDKAGVESLIESDAKSGFDLSQVPIEQYPYLRVVYNAKDEINLTPADWKNWIVLYEPVAEGVLLFKGTPVPQNLQEGQTWSTRFGFVNISEKNFSSPLKVELDVYTQSTQHRLTRDSLITPPAPRDTVFFNVYSSTLGKAGTNDVHVYVNKGEVPEQYYDNNFSTLPGYLLVNPDRIDPVLEVTIDGRQISNGDFVSTNPLIRSTLIDENPFIYKSDTLGVALLLSYPCKVDDCPFTRIFLSISSIKWYPATPTSDFRIDFTPTDLKEGEYILRVRIADASGNESLHSNGNPVSYEISFNVEPATTLAFNGVYPNPSNVGFFFNFDLSGNTLPEEFLLEIFSPTGQLVNSFGMDDVQQFYIGTNELIWDGSDATGKVLSNGVYLYRLRIKAGELDSVNTGRLVWLR